MPLRQVRNLSKEVKAIKFTMGQQQATLEKRLAAIQASLDMLTAKGEATEKGEKGEKGQKAQKAEKGETAEKGKKAEKAEKAVEKSEEATEGEQAEKGERAKKGDTESTPACGELSGAGPREVQAAIINV